MLKRNSKHIINGGNIGRSAHIIGDELQVLIFRCILYAKIRQAIVGLGHNDGILPAVDGVQECVLINGCIFAKFNHIRAPAVFCGSILAAFPTKVVKRQVTQVNAKVDNAFGSDAVGSSRFHFGFSGFSRGVPRRIRCSRCLGSTGGKCKNHC